MTASDALQSALCDLFGVQRALAGIAGGPKARASQLLAEQRRAGTA